jgi:hypothetical protein
MTVLIVSAKFKTTCLTHRNQNLNMLSKNFALLFMQVMIDE